MTIAQLLQRVQKYWLILVIIPTVLTLLAYPKLADKVDYKASISVGVSLNSLDYKSTNSDNYDRQLNSLSEYLANRFKSIEVQKTILKELGENDSKIDLKKPIYEISNQTSGFVNLSSSFSTEIKAKIFLQAIKNSYSNIIETEKNLNESAPFKIKPMDKFLETIVEVRNPIQLTLIPTIAGLLLALLIILFLPDKPTKPTDLGANPQTNLTNSSDEL